MPDAVELGDARFVEARQAALREQAVELASVARLDGHPWQLAVAHAPHAADVTVEAPVVRE